MPLALNEPHLITTHRLSSRTIQGEFNVKVYQPIRASGGGERFPVIFTTDADLFFDGLSSIANLLHLLGDTERFILVGIGYENKNASELLRWRDFVTSDIREIYRPAILRAAASPLVSGIEDIGVIFNTTDAQCFLHFITDELKRFIDATYPTNPDDTTYWGYSAGGAFGLYVLFHLPQSFQRYILGSPATSYRGHNFVIPLADAFMNAERTMHAALYMSVGGLEEFKKGHEDLDLVSGFYALLKFLGQNPVPGLSLKSEVFPRETHATAWISSFVFGVREFFGVENE